MLGSNAYYITFVNFRMELEKRYPWMGITEKPETKPEDKPAEKPAEAAA
jgi:hypothetical protein